MGRPALRRAASVISSAGAAVATLAFPLIGVAALGSFAGPTVASTTCPAPTTTTAAPLLPLNLPVLTTAPPLSCPTAPAPAPAPAAPAPTPAPAGTGAAAAPSPAPPPTSAQAVVPPSSPTAPSSAVGGVDLAPPPSGDVTPLAAGDLTAPPAADQAVTSPGASPGLAAPGPAALPSRPPDLTGAPGAHHGHGRSLLVAAAVAAILVAAMAAAIVRWERAEPGRIRRALSGGGRGTGPAASPH